MTMLSHFGRMQLAPHLDMLSDARRSSLHNIKVILWSSQRCRNPFLLFFLLPAASATSLPHLLLFILLHIYFLTPSTAPNSFPVLPLRRMYIDPKSIHFDLPRSTAISSTASVKVSTVDCCPIGCGSLLSRVLLPSYAKACRALSRAAVVCQVHTT